MDSSAFSHYKLLFFLGLPLLLCRVLVYFFFLSCNLTILCLAIIPLFPFLEPAVGTIIRRDNARVCLTTHSFSTGAERQNRDRISKSSTSWNNFRLIRILAGLAVLNERWILVIINVRDSVGNDIWLMFKHSNLQRNKYQFFIIIQKRVFRYCCHISFRCWCYGSIICL